MDGTDRILAHRAKIAREKRDRDRFRRRKGYMEKILADSGTSLEEVHERLLSERKESQHVIEQVKRRQENIVAPKSVDPGEMPYLLKEAATTVQKDLEIDLSDNLWLKNQRNKFIFKNWDIRTPIPKFEEVWGPDGRGMLSRFRTRPDVEYSTRQMRKTRKKEKMEEKEREQNWKRKKAARQMKAKKKKRMGEQDHFGHRYTEDDVSEEDFQRDLSAFQSEVKRYVEEIEKKKSEMKG